MRLFIAIKFNTVIMDSLINAQNGLKKEHINGNYTDQKNLHLTLAFIGEYNYPEKVIKALQKVRFRPFELVLEEESGNFEDLIWVGIKRNPDLMKLTSNLRKTLDESRIPFDNKKFVPHITIIRKANVPKQFKKPKIEKAIMTVEKISVMRSQRIDGKLVYTELGSAKANNSEQKT